MIATAEGDGDASVVQLQPRKMGSLEPAPAEATAAFTRALVTSNTSVTDATHFTVPLPTPAAERRPVCLKGAKNKTNRAEKLDSTAQRHREERGKHCTTDDALHPAQAWFRQSIKGPNQRNE